MAYKIAEGVHETSTNPGAGDYLLGGAVGTHRTFANELNAGDTTLCTAYDNSTPMAYVIYNPATFQTGANRIVRGTVIRSSNADLDITWGPGAVVNVVSGIPGKILSTLFDPSLGVGYVRRTGTTPDFAVQAVPIPIVHGGTGAVIASTARSNLGVAIGSDVQAYDADLLTIAGLAKTLGHVIFADGSAWTSAPLWPYLRGYLDGFQLSRTSATVLSVAAGVAVSEDASQKALRTTGAETVTLTVSGVGGLGVARATNTWYHVFAIWKDADGTTDVYADTSLSAANKPGGYSAYRRLGSFLTDATGSGEIIDFSQLGDEFLWKDPPLDVDAATPGTSAVARALTVPPGVKVHALVNAAGDFTDLDGGYLSSLDVNDEAPVVTQGAGTAPLASFGGGANTGRFNISSGPLRIRTDTSRQIRSRMSEDVRLKIATLGWIDRRGRDA